MIERRDRTERIMVRLSRRRLLAGAAALGTGMLAVANSTAIGQPAPTRPGPTPSPTPQPGTGSGNGVTPFPGTTNISLRQTIANLESAYAQSGMKGSALPGARKDYYLPFLFLRGFVGDTGTRPLPAQTDGTGSPDVLIVPGVDPGIASGVPSWPGDTAMQNGPNTVYAHVWNLGFAPAYDVFVEFFSSDYRDPEPQPLGQAWVDLGARGSGSSHKLVRCPNSFNPPPPHVVGSSSDFQLDIRAVLVRVRQFVGDPLGSPVWNVALNRHMGVRFVTLA